jgi:hypothetical protein
MWGAVQWQAVAQVDSRRRGNGARSCASALGNCSLYRWRLIFRWDGRRGEAGVVYLDDHSYK